MKKILLILTLLIAVFSITKTNAQLTNLSNNTNIKNGIALGSIGIMANQDGALWRTDGTVAGTNSYATTKVKVDTSVQAVVFNNKIYFSGIALDGKELWVTDGTDVGTTEVKDINAGSESSSPENFFVFNNAIYFFAKTDGTGIEPWKSDGTEVGTTQIKDINPGTANSFDNSFTSFFTNNNILYFNAKDGTNGTELWTTNGTSAGTVMLKDINPGSASSDGVNFTALGTSVIFSATDAAHGTELWKTDGTTGGTVLVQDIVSGASSSSPQQFVQFQSKIFFVTGTLGLSEKLYSTDGTSGGTTLIKSFGTGGAALLFNSIIINNKLYFSGSSLLNGIELWSTDGTTSGTGVFDDINPGKKSSTPIILADYFSYIHGGDYHTHLFNGKIFFIADDGTHGEELWITDGTVAGTNMVKDINPGADSSLTAGSFSSPWFYTANNFYFTANDGTHGIELFRTDGTSGGTSLIEDLNPGAPNSDPFMFMGLNNHIYLTADNGDNINGDRDLYILDESVVLPVSLLNFTAALNNKAVNLQWTTATEINTKNYTVQRSYNGLQFQNIGSVNAAGNSNKKVNYAFTDANALNTGADKIYYRLQITDNDGKVTYSSVAMVNVLPNGKLLVMYPNPVKDQLTLITNTTVNGATVRITGANGNVVYIKQFENLQAGTQNKINVSTLGKGVYYLEFISDNNKQTTRFIKY